jgi:DNA polymerase-3 subunit gamma/tau
MSYVAIARKWRPTRFEDISGQSHVTRTLRNAITLGRIHHAFLFTGARGVGKTTAARVLARALNCESGPTPDPCGTCAACKEILAGSSPDVIEIDGASNNSVDDIRDLRESVRYLPQRGRSKVYIVDEVHMLSKGAFNALLKTLEEPPPHVVFIFATTESNKIPDTILSRVQRFDFKRIPATVVVDRLAKICEAEGVSIPEAGLKMIARAGEGSMRDSQSLLDRVVSFGGTTMTAEQVAEVLGLVDRGLLYAMLEGMLQGEPDACLDAIDRVYSFGYDLSEFTLEMLELLRNATLVGLSPSSKRFLDVSDDERVRLEGLAKNVSPDVFVRSFQVMIEVHEAVSRAPRPRLVLEMAVARLTAIRPARPLDQIVDRLGEMERRLRHGAVGARPRSASGPGSSGGARGGEDDGEPRRGPPAPAPVKPATSPAPSVSSPVVAPPRPLRAIDLPPAEEDLRDTPPPRFEVEPLPPVELDGEEEGASGLVLPYVDPAWDERARFRALLDWLDKQHVRYNHLTEASVLLACRPPLVAIAMASDQKLANVVDLARDRVLIAGLDRCFPGCDRVTFELRSATSRQLTRREQTDLERAQLIELLKVEMDRHERVVQLKALFGARVTDVRPGHEPPPHLKDLR